MNRKISQYLIIVLLTVLELISAVFAHDTETILTITLNTKLENVSDFSLSSDGNKLLVAKTNGDLYIWDISIDEIILTIESSIFNATLNGISWSSDDSLIAGAFSDKGRIWSSQTGELISELDEHPRQPIFDDIVTGIDGIVFSPSEFLFATYHMLDTTILLYDQQTQTVRYELSDNVPESYVVELLFSPDGLKLAVRQFSGYITLWNTQTGQRLYQFLGEAMAFSPDSTMLATGMGRLTSNVWIWDLSNGNQLYELVAPLQVNQLQWANDNQTVYGRFGSPPLNDGWIYSGEAIISWDIFESTNNHIFALSENVLLPFIASEQIAIIGLGSYHLEGEILIWDRRDDEILRHSLSANTLEQDYTVFVNPIFTFDINLDQSLLATGHDEGIILWDVVTGEFQNMASTTNRIVKLNFLSANNGIVSLTNDNELLIFQVNN
jgi:WD40 repeat protein